MLALVLHGLLLGVSVVLLVDHICYISCSNIDAMRTDTSIPSYIDIVTWSSLADSATMKAVKTMGAAYIA